MEVEGGDGGPDSWGPDSAVLERVLDGCKTLKSLIINNNLINEGRDFDAVKGFLTNNTTITVLSLEDVGLETTPCSIPEVLIGFPWSSCTTYLI